MARAYRIPGPTTQVYDFQLGVTSNIPGGNRRCVILGTSEDGPMYEPQFITDPNDAMLVYGVPGRGDLVRGVIECFNSQTDTPNIVCVRIGNGEKAKLELYESDGETIDEKQAEETVSLKLEANNPGNIYNNVTIKYDDSRNVAVYNPKTDVTSTFSVDTENQANTTVDVHNVSELVDALNADTNVSSIVTASYEDIVADYELVVDSTTDGVSQNSTGVTLKLKKLFGTDDGQIADENNAFIIPEPELPYTDWDIRNQTVTNNLTGLLTVESVSNSEWEHLQFNGNKTDFKLQPLDGKNTGRWDTIQALKDYDDDSKYMYTPSGVSIVSEFMYNVNNALINEIPTSYKGLDETNTFTLKCPLPLDDHANEDGNALYNDGSGDSVVNVNISPLFDYMYGNADYDEYSLHAPGSGIHYPTAYLDATSDGVESKLVNGNQLKPSGIVQVFVSDQVDPNGNWIEVPYNRLSGVFISDYDVSTQQITFSVGPEASGCYDPAYSLLTTGGVKHSNLTALLDTDGYIKKNKYLRVRGNTVKGFLREVDTLPQLDIVTANVPTTYFVRGKEILLNTPAPFDMIVNYGVRIKYEPETSVILSDSANGEISFTNPDQLPGPGGGPISATKKSHIRIRHEYMPNFPLITSAAEALTGGTNGTILTTKERELELKNAYEYLKNFEIDILVPMGAYIDEVKEDWDPINGQKVKILNSYAEDVEDFLEELSINSRQPHCVLGVTPIEGETLADRDEWVNNLVDVDPNDPIKAANGMINIENKLISVAAFEPVFHNTGFGSPYTANGQAAYAGIIASLPYNVSPTNVRIPGIIAIRKAFSVSQLERFLEMRYVTMRTDTGSYPVILDDITAAPYGSDYTSWTTFSIVKEAADRVRAIAKTYIGQPNDIPVRNSLDNDVKVALDSMDGIRASEHTIKSTPDQQVLGIIDIDLVLVPIFTIKSIRTSIKISSNLASS